MLLDVLSLIQADEEVSWCDTALCCLLWYQKEVEALVVILILYQLAVDDTSRLRVRGLTIRSLDEHSLVDPFVHNHKSEIWHGELVVEWPHSFFELSDLLRDDLVSHLLTDTISVDDDL